MDSHLNLKNYVLSTLAELLKQHKGEIIDANSADIRSFPDMDDSMKDRLKVDEKKIEGMIQSLNEVIEQPDPENKELYSFTREDGLRIINKTVPFGTILIIYESRPDQGGRAVVALAEGRRTGGAPSRARTGDLRIKSP